MNEAERRLGGQGNGNTDNGAEPRRRRWIGLTPLIVFGAIAAVFVYQLRSGNDPSELPSTLIDQLAPDFDLAPLEGLANSNGPVPGFSTADLIGEVTVVNVWGSWCVPCRAEHPFIEALAEDGRFRVVGINQRDGTANALAFLAEFGNPYDAVGIDPRGRASIDWGVYGVPETFLIDRNGVIRHKIIGPIDERRLFEEVMPQLEALLAEVPGA